MIRKLLVTLGSVASLVVIAHLTGCCCCPVDPTQFGAREVLNRPEVPAPPAGAIAQAH